jgi:Rho GTPase-activating protein RGD1
MVKLPPLPQHIDRTNPIPHNANTPNSSHSHLPDRSRATFGVDLAEQMVRDGVEVPLIMVKCCEAIEKHGITTMGVYRVGGTMSKVTRLKEKLDRGTWLVLVDLKMFSQRV